MTNVNSNAAAIIDDAPIGRLQRTVFILCIMITVLDGFDTQSIAFAAPALAKAWGLTKLDFGFIFSATLLGSVAGTSVFGVLADRFGRRQLTIALVLLFGIASGLTAVCTTTTEMIVLRVIGGVGLGGVIPNTAALASEFAPQRSRATIVTVTLWGFPLGAIIGGLISAPLIGQSGWQAIFVVGAIMPLVLAAILWRALPESIRFLASKRERFAEAAGLLARIAPDRTLTVMAADTALLGPTRTGVLFGRELGGTTALLSAALFLSLLLSYLLVNWVPLMLSQSGMPASSAMLGTVGINAGGILGSFLMSRLVDNSSRPALLLGAGYVATGVTIAAVGTFVGASGAAALAGLTLCGFFLVGSQMSMTAFTATQFPVAVRASGIGFVQSIGRIGSLVGPMAGGVLLTAGMTTQALFGLCLVPALAAAAALGILAVIRAGAQQPRNPARVPT